MNDQTPLASCRFCESNDVELQSELNQFADGLSGWANVHCDSCLCHGPTITVDKSKTETAASVEAQAREAWNPRTPSLAPCPIKDEGEETKVWAEKVAKKIGRAYNSDWWRAYEILRACSSGLEKPEASPATTGKGPMELSGLLYEIEQRAEIAKIIDGPALLVRSADDVPALVKALRRALPAIEQHHFLKRDIETLLSAPSEGRTADEQGGLPVTPNKNDILQAASILRSWARDRQRSSGKWTSQEQAAVECAVRLEDSSPASTESVECSLRRRGWNLCECNTWVAPHHRECPHCDNAIPSSPALPLSLSEETTKHIPEPGDLVP